MSKFNDLILRVQQLHELGAFHVKRGFSLKDAKLTTASNHLIEEAVELQAEVLDGNYDTKLEEAADVLLVYLHLLHLSKVSFSEVVSFAERKLEKNFTLNRSEIKTKTPGYTRSNRDETQKPCDCYMDNCGPLSHWLD